MVSLLYSVDELEVDFKDLDVVSLQPFDVELAEGSYHRGKSSVVRLLARR